MFIFMVSADNVTIAGLNGSISFKRFSSSLAASALELNP